VSTAPLVELAGSRPRPARAGIEVCRAAVLGTSAWMAFRYDQEEACRRASVGLGSVVSWDLLDTLMTLPAGLPVQSAALSGAARRRVARAPAGVVRITGSEVIRDLVPALTPLLAIVTTVDWMDGLERASRFGAYCKRMVAGPPVTPAHEVMRTASRLGIGVAARARGAASVLLEPEPLADWQPTVAWWRFCEVIYAHAGYRMYGDDGHRADVG
jgi:hypothetical protein